MKRLLLVFILANLPFLVAQAGQWFEDPETGCRIWGDHEQPIVTVYWSGDCLEGKAHGQGTMRVLIDNIPFSQYEGEYKSGKADGYGVIITPDQSRYEGEFKDNIMHGKGVIISTDGKRLEGNFYKGFPHGSLTATSPDGTQVEMEFKNGRRVK